MPLVNRTSLRRYFVEDIEPAEWIDGDMWVDTSQASPELFINSASVTIISPFVMFLKYRL